MTMAGRELPPAAGHHRFRAGLAIADYRIPSRAIR
jgi:hypothetical protein